MWARVALVALCVVFLHLYMVGEETLDRLLTLVSLLIAVAALVAQYRWKTVPKWITDVGLIIGGFLLGLVCAPVVWPPEPLSGDGAGLRTALAEPWAWSGVGATGGAAAAILAIAIWPRWWTNVRSRGLTDVNKITEEIYAFSNSWLLPAAQNLSGVVQRVLAAMQQHESAAVRGQVGLIQRSIVDEERRALSRLTNALSSVQRANSISLQEDIALYYRAYQQSRTWIAKGLELTSLDLSKDAIFQEWLRIDLDFLRELRRLTGPLRYNLLRSDIAAVGWGENVTRDILATSSAIKYLPAEQWHGCRTCECRGWVEIAGKIKPCPEPHCSCGLIVSRDVTDAG